MAADKNVSDEEIADVEQLACPTCGSCRPSPSPGNEKIDKQVV
jgi:hypothetical protein